MRIAFVSVGHTPRTDVLSDLLANLKDCVAATEIGGLDGLTQAEIESFRALPGEAPLVTKLRDGSDIVLSKSRISDRLASIVSRLDASEFDLVVILTTGLLRGFESRCMTINSQRAMEAGIEALAVQGARIGIIQPLAEQVNEPAIPAFSHLRVRLSHAAPGDLEGLRHAVSDLSNCEILALNSIGFSEEDRATVARFSGLPVVLARRLVGSAMRVLLDARRQAPAAPGTSDLQSRVERLTPREKQVMLLAAEGLSNKAVGRQLGISPKTVEIHRSKVMNKLEVPSTAALIRLVLSSGHPGFG